MCVHGVDKSRKTEDMKKCDVTDDFNLFTSILAICTTLTVKQVIWKRTFRKNEKIVTQKRFFLILRQKISFATNFVFCMTGSTVDPHMVPMGI